MDTLYISKTLQASAIKRDLYFLGAVMVAGFGYIVATQNTIINAITLISK